MTNKRLWPLCVLAVVWHLCGWIHGLQVVCLIFNIRYLCRALRLYHMSRKRS
jgi:hypothetical protein